jgi:hypothetical protein
VAPKFEPSQSLACGVADESLQIAVPALPAVKLAENSEVSVKLV